MARASRSCVHAEVVAEQVSRIEGPWPAAEVVKRTQMRQWPLSSLRRPSILASTGASVPMPQGQASQDTDGKGPGAASSLATPHPECVSPCTPAHPDVRHMLSSKPIQAPRAACLASLNPGVP